MNKLKKYLYSLIFLMSIISMTIPIIEQPSYAAGPWEIMMETTNGGQISYQIPALTFDTNNYNYMLDTTVEMNSFGDGRGANIAILGTGNVYKVGPYSNTKIITINSGVITTGLTGSYSVATTSDITGVSSIYIKVQRQLKSTPLVGTHTLSTTNIVKTDVIINVSVTNPSDAASITIPGGTVITGSSASYSAPSNGTYNFEVKDNIGNILNYPVTITNIDKTLPTITIGGVDLITPTKNNLSIPYNASDLGGDASGISKLEIDNIVYPNSGNFTVSSNGSYVFKATDVAGNVHSTTVVVSNIDKSLPTASHTLSNSNLTNQNVSINLNSVDVGVSGIKRIQLPDNSYVNSDNTTYVVSSNGTYVFNVEDNAGNILNYSVNITNINKVPPVISVQVYNTTPQNTDLTVVLNTNNESFVDEGTTLNTPIISNGGKTLTYTFTQNETTTFKVIDNWGNISTRTLAIDNIDKVKPTIEVSKSNINLTNQNYNLNATFKDINGTYNSGIKKIILPDATEKTFNDNRTTHSESFIVSSNGTYVFRVEDNAGNQELFSIDVTNINKTPPTITVDTYNTTPQNTDLTVNVSAVDSEGTNLNSVLNSVSHVFSVNGNFTFTVTDKWGNQTDKQIIITNIDKTLPDLNIVQEIPGLTNQNYNLITTFTDNSVNVFNSGIKKITLPDGTIQTFNDNRTTHTSNFLITENKIYTFKIEDNAGNSYEKSINVTNINKISPVITTNNYETKPTNKDINVILMADKGKFYSMPGANLSNNSSIISYTFTTNESKTFTVKDDWGNITTKTINIENISKNGPIITLNNYNKNLTDQNITVTATVDKGNLNASSYTFTENGTFTFVAADSFGNVSKKTVIVNNIDKVLPVITVNPYNTNITNKDIIVTVSTNKGTLNASSHTFTQNGTFTFTTTDSLGRTDSKTITITNIDKVLPIITIQPYVMTPVNTNIIVNASVDKGTLNSASHTFTENGDFIFIATDEAGNLTQKKVIINNINKQNPTITLDNYNTNLTNQDVPVNVYLDKGKFTTVNVIGGKAQILSKRDNKINLNFPENDIVEVTAIDDYGNTSVRTINISNINKNKPTISIVPYNTNQINDDLIVNATAVDSLGNDITNLLNKQSYTFTENGSFVFSIVDPWGNTNNKTVNITNINKILPKITILPYSTDITNGNITVRAITDKGNLNQSEYTFIVNGSFEFTATDEYGNISKKIVNITNIDKDAPVPVIKLSESNPTNKDILITVEGNDANGIYSIKYGPDDKPTVTDSYKLTVKVNGTYNFTLQDMVGNEINTDVVINNIDKTPPIITINPYNSDLTNEDVVVTASTNEGTLNENSFIFKKNGTFIFIATDDVGNITEKSVTITNIEKDEPDITILPYIQIPTNKNIVVTANVNKGTFDNGQTTMSHTFEENGSFDFIARTPSGVVGTQTVNITNINKIAPTISISNFDPITITAEDILVNATGVDFEGTSLSVNPPFYKFTDNGSVEFSVMDKWGNITKKTVSITNINKEPPRITIKPYTLIPTNQPITIEAMVNKGTLNTNSHTFTENGEFTFTATDTIGNQSELTVKILNIDKTPPVITINPYNTEVTNGNVIVSASVSGGTLEQNTYTFVNNGSFTFKAVDEAGNLTEKIVTISNIVKIPPKITILPYNKNLTNQPVLVTAMTDKGVFENGDGQEVYIFNENGTYTFKATDSAGNVATETITINNISKVLPEITVVFDNNDLTTKSVTATATTNKGIFPLSGTNTEIYVFTENGTYTFIAVDEYGNKRMKTITVDTINADKTNPVITIEPYATTPTNKDVVIHARTDKGILNETSHTFTENGEFTFVAEDIFGNKGYKKVVINHILKSKPPTPSIQPFIDEKAQIRFELKYDDTKIIKVMAQYNDNDWFDITRSNPFNKLPDGTYNINVKGIDFAGNESNIFNCKFVNQNSKSAELLLEIKNISGMKFNSGTIGFIKEFRTSIYNKISKMETSIEKEFLSQQLYNLLDKAIATYEGNDIKDIQTTESKIRVLFETLKKDKNNETVINNIKMLISSISDESKRLQLTKEMNDIISGQIVNDKPTTPTNPSTPTNPNTPTTPTNPSTPSGPDDSKDSSNNFGTIVDEVKNTTIRNTQDMAPVYKYDDISALNEQIKTDNIQSLGSNTEIKNLAKTLTDTTPTTTTFNLKPEDVKMSNSNATVDMKLVQALQYKEVKDVQINMNSQDKSITFDNISFNALGKNNITFDVKSKDVELYIPIQKFNSSKIDKKSSDIKVEIDTKISNDSKIKGNIIDLSVSVNNKEIKKSDLSTYYSIPIELTLKYENNGTVLMNYDENSKTWKKVQAYKNDKTQEIIVQNPEFTQYAFRIPEQNISNATLSRGKAIDILINELDIQGNGFSSFKDVSTTNPYYDSISLAQQNGLLTDYGTSFKPNTQIDKNYAIDLLIKTANDYLGKSITKTELSNLVKNNKTTLTETEFKKLIDYIQK